MSKTVGKPKGKDWIDMVDCDNLWKILAVVHTMTGSNHGGTQADFKTAWTMP